MGGAAAGGLEEGPCGGPARSRPDLLNAQPLLKSHSSAAE